MKANQFMAKTAAVASCYTISARKWTYSSKQLTTHCDTLLRNGIKISGDAWWLFVHLCGIDAVEEMMAEPDFYPA